jgi:hypothetical protein
MLLAIRRFMMDRTIANGHKQDVWDVLTALRGPDEERAGMCITEFKASSTAVVRHALLGEDANQVGYLMMVHPDSAEAKKARTAEDPPVGGHFRRHINSAFRALKMKWNRVNTDSPLLREQPKKAKGKTRS